MNLYCTGYNKNGYGYYGINEIFNTLNHNGDFRNEECIQLLKKADIIITNPPFSLFRMFVKQLMAKEFIVAF